MHTHLFRTPNISRHITSGNEIYVMLSCDI